MGHALTSSGLLVPTSIRQADAVVVHHDGNVTAAAHRVDLTAADQVRRARAGSISWQDEAWAYLDNVPEVKFAAGFTGAAMSRLRLFAGYIVEPDEPPVPVREALEAGAEGLTEAIAAAAEAALARIGGPDEQAEHLAAWGECLTISGDSSLVGRQEPSPIEGGPPTEVWKVYSESVVTKSKTRPDGLALRLDPEGKAVIELDPATSVVIRVWREHPRWPALADSNMRAILGECEELLIYGRQFRAVGKSRNNAGILYVANEIGDPPTVDGKPTSWELGLARSMTQPVLDDGSPSAMVPHIVRGPAMLGSGTKAIAAKDALFHLALDRKIDEKAIDRVAFLIQRAAHGLDVPVEVLTGVADVNHWTAWQIEDSTYKAHIEPKAAIPARALTRTILRVSLQASGLVPGDSPVLKRLVVGIDPSALVMRPNRAQDAKDAYDRFAIGWAALRKHLGFSDSEAPDEEELVRRLAIEANGTSSPIQVAQLNEAEVLPTEAVADAADAVGGGSAGELGTGAEAPAPAEDEQPVPGTQQAAAAPMVSMRVLQLNNPVAAAVLAQDDATDADRARVLSLTAAAITAQLGERLAAIDRTAMEALSVAAGDTVTNAMRVVGQRLKARAQGDPAQADAVKGLAPEDAAAALAGIGAVALADIEPLAAEQIDPLRARYDQWVAASYDDTAAALNAIAEDDRASEDAVALLRAQQDDDTEAGWLVLQAALVGIVGGRLLTPDGSPDDGEVDTALAVPRGPARQALARAGGIVSPGFQPAGVAGEVGPGFTVGGVATGPRTVVAMRSLGYTVSRWVWHTGRPSVPFPPHQALGGISFSSWDDPVLANAGRWPPFGRYFPGDHPGCACSVVPAIDTIEEG